MAEIVCDMSIQDESQKGIFDFNVRNYDNSAKNSRFPFNEFHENIN